jgi:hypothetical protein
MTLEKRDDALLGTQSHGVVFLVSLPAIFVCIFGGITLVTAPALRNMVLRLTKTIMRAAATKKKMS